MEAVEIWENPLYSTINGVRTGPGCCWTKTRRPGSDPGTDLQRGGLYPTRFAGKGRQSVNRYPANHLADRLLADSYAALPGIEVARASELLQAQLLQPINITPVSPRMAETRLALPSAGPLSPSCINSIRCSCAKSPHSTLRSGRQSERLGDELIVAGLTERFSYSLGQFHYQSNGYRPNNDLENNLYNLFFQTAVTPQFNLQAEYRSLETFSGDLESRYDGSFRSFQRTDVEQEMARVGARYAPSPQTHLIASVVYTDRDFLKSFPNVNAFYEQRIKGTQVETQLLYRQDAFNIISGLSAHFIDYNNYDVNRPVTESTQKIAYSYANIKIPDNVIWTLGLSYESDDSLYARLNELNPKLGVQWAINDQVSLRAAAFQTVKREFATRQTIEPTQVAGFNQIIDFIDLTVSKNYGVGLDVRFTDRLSGGLEALKRDNKVPFGALDVPEPISLSRIRKLFIAPIYTGGQITIGRFSPHGATRNLRRKAAYCANSLHRFPRNCKPFLCR